MYGYKFKDHVLIETHLKEGDYNLDIWDFKRPDSTHTDRIRFINSCGTMTVNGDYGNWVFCREFHPSKDGKVSKGYWDEKLQIASKQESHDFDTDETFEQIDQFEKDYLENEYMTEEIEDWIETLRHSAYDKLEYENAAYRENPSNIDYENIPYGTKRHIWLEVIYDAFNEICKRYQ